MVCIWFMVQNYSPYVKPGFAVPSSSELFRELKYSARMSNFSPTHRSRISRTIFSKMSGGLSLHASFDSRLALAENRGSK